MFVSLRFPDRKEYPQFPLTDSGILQSIPESLFCSEGQREVFLRLFSASCADPEVLNYRAELAEELISSPALETIFTELSRLNISHEHFIRSGGTVEITQLQTVTAFRDFAQRFDRFCETLSAVVPQSTAAKRCFLFCRNYAESFEYKELKGKAAELIRTMGFSYGFSLEAGNPFDPSPAVRLRKESTPADGVYASANNVLEEFGACSEEEPTEKRPYTDMEIAVLTGMIRRDAKLSRRLEEFTQAYADAGTEELLRLSEEALFFTAANEIYKAGRNAGYSLCRPQFRNLGFYSEITDLSYPTEQNTVAAANYAASPLEHVMVVCGPDSEAYAKAVEFAHIAASAGGLIFAKEAQISPVNVLEADKNRRISTDRLDENGLCLCYKLFDAMLPRQEEVAVREVLLRLGDRNVRSVVRICSKSNLTVLQKEGEANRLPPCTPLQLGTDRTLEELLQRHHLTAEQEGQA